MFTSASEHGSTFSYSFQPAGPWHQEKGRSGDTNFYFQKNVLVDLDL